MVTAIGWTPTNECYSVSDEKSIWKWGIDGEPDSKIADVDSFVTDFKWLSSVKGGTITADIFVVGCSDGKH
jgi:hypothetical protein